MRTLPVRCTIYVVEDHQNVADRSPMKTQLPVTTEGEQGEHRVLKFRPRSSRPPHQRDDALDRRRQDSSRQDHSRPDHTRQEPAQQEANDFSHFERDRQPPDDFHHRIDRDRGMARHEYRRSAQDSGLRADGTPGLRPHRLPAHLTLPPRYWTARNRGLSGLPTAIELRAALRYTGIQLRMREHGSLAHRPPLLAVPTLISNISKV